LWFLALARLLPAERPQPFCGAIAIQLFSPAFHIRLVFASVAQPAPLLGAVSSFAGGTLFD